MLAIFFDWQDSCHICQLHIVLLFEKTPQEVQIIFLDILPLFCDPEYTVPFVDDEDEALMGLLKYFVQYSLEPCIGGETAAFGKAFF